MEEDQEMARVREIFERALNAIVSATQLAKEVDSLRGDVSSLRSEIDNVRAYNQRLDVELTATREQRDQALRDKSAAIGELNQARVELNQTQKDRDDWRVSHDTVAEVHESLKREHDNVQMQALELEEENKSLKAQLEKVKAVFGIQPRDVSTGQWESTKNVLQEAAPEPNNDPNVRTGTEPYWR